MSNEDRRSVRGICVERRLRNQDWLDITTKSIPFLVMQAPRNPADAADRLLLNLAVKSSEPAVFTSLDVDHDPGMAFTEAVDSLVGYLEFLQSEGLIQFTGSRREGPQFAFRLTLSGWRRIQQIQMANHESQSAFVAMSFQQDRVELYDIGIQPAITQAGWTPIRADRTHHTQRIDDWILNQIATCRLVVVDTTEDNSGAAFEAGFALGKGRPVIWVVRKDWLAEGLHFDFRQYNHLTWEPGKEAALVGPLAERIIATVGRGNVVKHAKAGA